MGILQKSPVLQGKRPGIQSKRSPKYRYCFSCLKVMGGSRPSKSKFLCCCRASVLSSGKEALDIASDDPPDEVLRNGPNTVSGSTVSNTELSEVFWGSPSSGERTQ